MEAGRRADSRARTSLNQEKGNAMIKSVEHFSFTVSNIEAALQFFQDLLGLDASAIMQVENRVVRQVVGMPDAVLRISLVQLPGDNKIELIEYVRPEGKKVDSKPCNPGIAHVAFVVDDIQKAYQELNQKGIEFVNPPVWAPGNDGSGRWGVCYLKGPDGITIELIEKQS
jgi:catechol 2,3-dioxygenase-like lactoylglutathione lyase family enzyme